MSAQRSVSDDVVAYLSAKWRRMMRKIEEGTIRNSAPSADGKEASKGCRVKCELGTHRWERMLGN